MKIHSSEHRYNILTEAIAIRSSTLFIIGVLFTISSFLPSLITIDPLLILILIFTPSLIIDVCKMRKTTKDLQFFPDRRLDDDHE